MISWNDAYLRINESDDFRLQFGRMYMKDEFRYYAQGVKFESIPPALLSDGTAVNTMSLSTTQATLAAPTTNIVPGNSVSQSVSFPSGAVILGFTAASVIPQCKNNVEAAAFFFKYGPSWRKARRDLFLIQLLRSDGEPVTAGMPIDPILISANVPYRGDGFGLGDAVLGDGDGSNEPGDPIVVTPGLDINVSVRSMCLPVDVFPTATGTTTPAATQTVHVVFHCMIPGTIQKRRAQ